MSIPLIVVYVYVALTIILTIKLIDPREPMEWDICLRIFLFWWLIPLIYPLIKDRP